MKLLLSDHLTVERQREINKKIPEKNSSVVQNIPDFALV